MKTNLVHIGHLLEAEQWFPDERYGRFVVIEDPCNKGQYKEIYEFIQEGTDDFGVIYTPEHAFYNQERVYYNKHGQETHRKIDVHWMKYGEWKVLGKNGDSFIPNHVVEQSYKEVEIEEYYRVVK